MYRKLAIVVLAGLATAACHKAAETTNEGANVAAPSEAAAPENVAAMPENMAAPAENVSEVATNAAAGNESAAMNAAAPAGK